MSVSTSNLEFESFGEPEDELHDDHEFEEEYEFEFEGDPEFEEESEVEGESEAEEFFGRVARLSSRPGPSGALERIGVAAARGALQGLGAGAADPRRAIVADLAVDGAPHGRTNGAPAHDGEPDWSVEPAMPGGNETRADSAMEHLGHAASVTMSEPEAEAFVGALVPLAARVVPRAAPILVRAAPELISGAARIARTLRRNPRTRPMVRVLPSIITQTAAQLARQSSDGRPVTPQKAVTALASQAARILSSPEQCARAWKRSKALDRGFHGKPSSPRPTL